MRMFRPFRQVAAQVGHQTTLFGRDRQLAAPGAKSAVSDYMLFFVFAYRYCYDEQRFS